MMASAASVGPSVGVKRFLAAHHVMLRWQHAGQVALGGWSNKHQLDGIMDRKELLKPVKSPFTRLHEVREWVSSGVGGGNVRSFTPPVPPRAG